MELWTSRYNPRTTDDYVWRDPEQRAIVEKWIADRILPHLMLTGRAGTGKSSLAKLCLNLIGIPRSDILVINASRERKVDEIMERIQQFVGCWADNDTGMRYVLLEEADSLSALSQRALRADMETYENAARFIFTANYPERLIEAVHSRCQAFHIEGIDRDQFTLRLADILMQESVDFDIETFDQYVEATYPDMRKALNLCQQNSTTGKLEPLKNSDSGSRDYVVEMANLFRARRFTEARKLIISQVRADEYVDIYRYLYQNLNIWSNDANVQDDALIIIRDGLRHHAHVADSEINLSAVLAELARLVRA
jgi:DNA polymerase III delta prime subunit